MVTSQPLGECRPAWWKVWLPVLLILGSPWLLAAITLSLAIPSELGVLPFGPGLRWLARINWLLAFAGSGYGGLFSGGPLPIRVAVSIATAIYGGVVYMILMIIPQAFGLSVDM